MAQLGLDQDEHLGFETGCQNPQIGQARSVGRLSVAFSAATSPKHVNIVNSDCRTISGPLQG